MKASEKLDLIIQAMPNAWENKRSKIRLFISPPIYRELAKEKKRDYPKTYKGFKICVVGNLPDHQIEAHVK